jgi:hypothetical protein
VIFEYFFVLVPKFSQTFNLKKTKLDKNILLRIACFLWKGGGKKKKLIIWEIFHHIWSLDKVFSVWEPVCPSDMLFLKTLKLKCRVMSIGTNFWNKTHFAHSEGGITWHFDLMGVNNIITFFFNKLIIYLDFFWNNWIFHDLINMLLFTWVVKLFRVCM